MVQTHLSVFPKLFTVPFVKLNSDAMEHWALHSRIVRHFNLTPYGGQFLSNVWITVWWVDPHYMAHKSFAELIIPTAHSALGLCTSQHITKLWLTGDSACDRWGDADWSGQQMLCPCPVYVVREWRTADRLNFQCSSPRGLKAWDSSSQRFFRAAVQYMQTNTLAWQCHGKD